tara:strand:- start:553 stop:807 length:255 start_codon:yes stop_codon:yes gene_type:complete
MYGKGELSDATDYIDESIEIFQDLNNKTQLASLNILKANILIDRKKLKKVEKCLDKAEKYMKRLNDPILESNLQITKQKYNDLI